MGTANSLQPMPTGGQNVQEMVNLLTYPILIDDGDVKTC